MFHRPLILAAALLAAATAAPAGAQTSNAPAPTLSQVRSWAAACANCHGTNGNAQEGMVTLAGQPKDNMLKALLEFKTGKRPATIMHQLAKGYSDEELDQLATYFANVKK